MLRFCISGPLHWLGAVNLGLAAQQRFCLSTTGYAWLTAQPSQTESPAGRLTVLADYTILVPGDAPLLDRFGVSRFTTWEPPTRSQPEAEPTFCYRITQSGLRRATEQGIDALRVLAFLQDRCAEPLPAPVISGLQRWQNQSTSV